MEPGERFGPYLLDALLHRGATGEVYRAHDTTRYRTVALKLLPAELHDDSEYRTRFRRQSHVAARISDPHVIPIHGFGEINGRLYIDMRLVEGTDLAAWLRANGPMPADVAVAVIGQVAQALDAVHAGGLLHHDVKPSNILLAGITSRDIDTSVFVYLIGLAEPPGGTTAGGITATGSVVGAPDYMAPERLSAEPPDRRADVYSLACVLYESLTGERPFPSSSVLATAAAHFYTPPPKPSAAGAPAALDAVVAQGMAKDRSGRYPTTRALAVAARRALEEPPGTATGAYPTWSEEPYTQRYEAPGGSGPPTTVGPAPSGPRPAPSAPPPPPSGYPPEVRGAPRPRKRRPWLPRWPRRRQPRARPDVAAPPPPPTSAAPAADRRVAVAIVDSRGAVPTEPLGPALTYLLRFTIGGDILGNIVRSAPPFPVARLKRTTPAGWWLAIAVHGDGVDIPAGPHPMFLPVTGAAWACGCEPGGAHSCEPRDRWATVDLPFRAPSTPCIAGALVSVYSGETLAQAVRVTIPVGAVGAIRPSAVVTYSLGPDLGDVAHREPRDLSVLSEEAPRDGRHLLHVKSSGSPPVPFELVDAAAAEGARHVRSLLFASHLVPDGDRWASRYGPGHSTDVETYTADLRRLAVAGSEVFLGLFGGRGAELRASLVDVGRRTGRPAEIQVARAINTRLTVPWQLVYDEPIDDARAPAVCPSVVEFGPGSANSHVPPVCPNLQAHDRTTGTLCPFGFWGLAHHVECPPPTFTRALPNVTGDEPPPSLTVALHADLATGAWPEHDRVLRTFGRSVPVHDVDALRRSVLMGTDVLYFYCHGARVERDGSSAPRPVLDLGPGGRLSPLTLQTWSTGAPPVRWDRRHPLVVLNGCHTGEVLPDVPAELVSAFVDGLGAAGVVATEIAVEAALAATAMELFLHGLFHRHSVGEAMRAMRWKLLARGNVLGLAYAAYCDARLRLPGGRTSG